VILEVDDLEVSYGAISVLHGVSLGVRSGEIVTLVGANGAGKSTTLRAVSGLVGVRAGSVKFCGEEITNLPAHEIVGRGVVHVPEGRMIFGDLTVRENLQIGAYLRHDKHGIRSDLEFVLEVFPRLRERIGQFAGTLSGGEQQMLAIGRALMGRPRLLMLDEPSLGIAPLLVKAIFEKICAINRDLGLTVLLVEQNAKLALEVSNHGYVLETGRVLFAGESGDLRKDPRVHAAYLGG
jgi:branched-chain amino acid transport system ATP-binding protein